MVVRRQKMLQVAALDSTVYHLLLPLVRSASSIFEVHVACAGGPYTDKITSEGYPVHIVDFERNLRIGQLLRSSYQLYRLIKAEKFDVVHTHTPIAGILGRLVAWFCGVPCIVNTAHGFYFHENMRPLPKYLAVTAEKVAGRVTTFSFFQSQEDYQAAQSLGICRHETGLWIGNGVDQTRFNPEREGLNKAAGEFRNEIEANPDDVVVCIVARLVREKGILELLQALRRLVPGNRTVHLVLVGENAQGDRDSIEESIRDMIRENAAGKRVHALGRRSDVEVILKASDIFVLPSYREGMPRSIIEAMSMGLPVIATDIRGCREEVADSETGYIVPVKNEKALAEAIQKLVDDEGLRVEFGKAGLLRARALYNEECVLERQIEVFTKVLLPGRRRK